MGLRGSGGAAQITGADDRDESISNKKAAIWVGGSLSAFQAN